jgi:broad specificity phosphatase PhoE
MTITSRPVEIFLARHGQTEWNLVGRWQGQLDSPLTNLGVNQARRQADLLDGLGIDAVLSSPLGRSQATARIVADRLGLSLLVLDDLAELHHGEYAGLTPVELAERPAWSERATDKYDWRFPGGESYRDADTRAARVIASVMRLEAKRPLLVSHEMIGRMLIKNLLGMTPNEALTTDQPHSTVYRFDVGAQSLTTLQVAREWTGGGH